MFICISGVIKNTLLLKLIMEGSTTEEGRKRKHSSSSSGDELDMNVEKEPITKLENEQLEKRQKIKDEVSDFEQKSQDIPSEKNTSHSLPPDSITLIKREDPSEDRYSDLNEEDVHARSSVDSDSEDEHFSRYCSTILPRVS